MANQLVTFDILYINDPTQSRALFNAKLFFGQPDTDPEIPSNQIPVYAVQEDGTEVELPQPVRTNSGGNPEYNGSPVRLSIGANYSFKILNRNDAQTFYIHNVGLFGGGGGSSAQEEIVLANGQLQVSLSALTTTGTSFYLCGSFVDRGRLLEGTDYELTSGSELTSITLFNSQPAGARLLAEQGL